jgi:hypothetical protein
MSVSEPEPATSDARPTLWDQAVEDARFRVAEYLRVSDALNVQEQIVGYVTSEGRFRLTRTDLLVLTEALDPTPGRPRPGKPAKASSTQSPSVTDTAGTYGAVTGGNGRSASSGEPS